jgi:hypothetical protein
LGYEVNLGVKVGVKHPAGKVTISGEDVKGSVRHEWSPFDGFGYKATHTTSIGNLEVIGFDVEPGSAATVTDALIPNLSKVGALKYDQQIRVGPVPVVIGGTLDVLNGEGGLRGGVGTKDYNVYAEVEFSVEYVPNEAEPHDFLPGVNAGSAIITVSNGDGTQSHYYNDKDAGVRVKTVT